MMGGGAWAIVRLGALSGGGPAQFSESWDLRRTIDVNRVWSVAIRNDPSLPVTLPVTRPVPDISAALDLVGAAVSGLQGRYRFEKGAVCRDWYEDPAWRDLSDIDLVVADEPARREMAVALATVGWHATSESGLTLTLAHDTYVPVDIRVTGKRWVDGDGDRQPPSEGVTDLVTSILRRGTLLIKDVNDVAALATHDPDALRRAIAAAPSPQHSHVLDHVLDLDARLRSCREDPLALDGDIPVPLVTRAPGHHSSRGVLDA